MNLPDGQKQVSEWMQTFGQKVEREHVMPDLETRKLRLKLILEESFETVEALGFRVIRKGDSGSEVLFTDLDFLPEGSPDITATRDGLADLLVVTLGAANSFGINASSDFNEVMRSNCSKMWTDEECSEAFDLSMHSVHISHTLLKRDKGLTAKRVSNETRCWVVKDASGKICKSPSYSEAKLI